MVSRRDFLMNSALFAVANSVPAFVAATTRASRSASDGRVLVILQLDGGNDGINTVIPYADDGYFRNRRALRIKTDQLVKINGELAFHPSLQGAAKLLASGRLTIVQGVGYPNPSRSHARSVGVWQTARLEPEEHHGHGWVGRALDNDPPRRVSSPSSLFIGTRPPPVALWGRRASSSSLAQLEDYTLPSKGVHRDAVTGASPPDNELAAFIHRTILDAYTTADRLETVISTRDNDVAYPKTGLASRLRLIARLIKSELHTRVYYTFHEGYDTHAAQLHIHANLLDELGGALLAFLDDLKKAGQADRVVVLAFSEFGRRLQENASHGTDHGNAGPVFLAGASVNSGVVGTTPSLNNVEDGDLSVSLDFRRVYATVLEEWLNVRARLVLGSDFEGLPLFRK